VTAGELQFMLQNLGIQVRDELINDLINEASHSGNPSLNKKLNLKLPQITSCPDLTQNVSYFTVMNSSR